MENSYATLLTLAQKNLTDRLETLTTIFGDIETVRRMTIAVPTLFGYGEDNIREKVQVMNDCGISNESISSHPNRLMQGPELTYCRYRYYTDKGYTFNEANYFKLFAGSRRFESQEGLTKSELIDKYHSAYVEYKKGKESASTQGSK